MNRFAVHINRERISIRARYAYRGTGPYVELLEVLQEAPVAFEHADDGEVLFDLTLIETLQAAAPAIVRRIDAHAIAVRTSSAFSQSFAQLAFEIGGDGVLQLLGFIVDLVPFHAEDFCEHALDEVVPVQETVRYSPAGARESDLPFAAYADELIALEPPDGHGNGRRRNLEPAYQRRGNYVLAFRFRLGDGFEVVLLRDGDFQASSILPVAEAWLPMDSV